MAQKTFLKITNQDIYNEQKRQGESLEEIKRHVVQTNGTVKWHTKWLYGLTGFIVTLLGYMWGFK